MMVSATIFKQLGGFDEALGPGAPFRGIEDGDLDYRALCAGYEVVQDPGSSVLHWGVKEYASGAARRTIQEYLFSVGAYFVKHSRCWDLIALCCFVRFLAKELWLVAVNLMHNRRPLGAGQVVNLLHGAWSATRWPIDRQRRMFRINRT